MEFVTCVNEALEALAVLRGEWDQLALLPEQPFSAPAWVLACWLILASASAALCAAAVRRGKKLMAVFAPVAEMRTCMPVGGDGGEATIRFQQHEALPDRAEL